VLTYVAYRTSMTSATVSAPPPALGVHACQLPTSARAVLPGCVSAAEMALHAVCILVLGPVGAEAGPVQRSWAVAVL
jgi:hypothetical protein